MDFFVGLLTGAFVIIVLLTFFVMHVLHINLDLPSIEKCQQNGVLAGKNSNNKMQTTDSVGKSMGENGSSSNPIDITEQHLRQTIQRILAETIKMPAGFPYIGSTDKFLNRSILPNGGNTSTKFTNSEAAITKFFQQNNYQDLLATAVLNKIVDINHNNRLISESTPDLRKTHYDTNEDNFNIESQSVASDVCYNRKQGRLYHRNGKLKNHFIKRQRTANYISKVTSETETDNDLETETESADINNGDSGDDDYISATSSVNPGNDGTWKRNWLLKKKIQGSRLGGVYTPNGKSMSMLVPDPKEDVRTLIGDKTTDEISDLSDIESEEDEVTNGGPILDENLPLDSLNDRLLNKHLIGGQNHKLLLDELSEDINREHEYQDLLDVRNQQLYQNKNAKETHLINETSVAVNHLEDIHHNEDDKQIIAEKEKDQQGISSNNCPTILNRHLIIKDNNHQTIKDLTTKLNTKDFSTNNHLDTNNTNTYYNHLNKHNININTSTSISSSNSNTTTRTFYCQPKSQKSNTKRFKTFCQLRVIGQNHDSATPDNLMVNTKNSLDHKRNASNSKDEFNEILTQLPKLTPGSIAEREYKKWYNAVEMPNNPYTAEALKRRINNGNRECCIDLPNINSNSRNSTEVLKNLSKDSDHDSDSKQHEMHIKRYSRDYYINNGESKSNSSIIGGSNGAGGGGGGGDGGDGGGSTEDNSLKIPQIVTVMDDQSNEVNNKYENNKNNNNNNNKINNNNNNNNNNITTKFDINSNHFTKNNINNEMINWKNSKSPIQRNRSLKYLKQSNDILVINCKTNAANCPKLENQIKFPFKANYPDLENNHSDYNNSSDDINYNEHHHHHHHHHEDDDNESLITHSSASPSSNLKKSIHLRNYHHDNNNNNNGDDDGVDVCDDCDDYDYCNYNHHNDNDDDDIDADIDDDLSQNSWNSLRKKSPLKQRRTTSMLNVYNSNGDQNNTTLTNRSHYKSCYNFQTDSSNASKVFTQFEKQLLHKDLKRNSFRAALESTKDFVINPVFEQEHFYNDLILKTNLAERRQEEQQQQCERPDEGQLMAINGRTACKSPESGSDSMTSCLTIGIYKATVAKVIELDDQHDLSPISFTSDSNPDSDESNTIGIYNFKRQQTIILRNHNHHHHQQSEAEVVDGGMLKPLIQEKANEGGEQQEKKKQNVIWTMSSFEKPVIETDIVEALPSVKALAKAFQSSDAIEKSPRSKKILSDSLRHLHDSQQTKRISKMFNGTNRKYATINHSPQKNNDNTSAIIARRCCSNSSIDLKENIAFFENLK